MLGFLANHTKLEKNADSNAVKMYDLCLKSTKVLHRHYSNYRQSVDFQWRYTEIVIVSTEVLYLIVNYDYLCDKKGDYRAEIRNI